MAADVSRLVQILGRYKEEGEDEGKAGSLVTRDLLGGCSVSGEKELDHELKVPGGWNERLDPMWSEEPSRFCQPATATAADKLQGLVNRPPLFISFTPPSPNLDLKLFTPSPSACPTTAFNHSVCTLDKVKSALERAAKRNPHAKGRSSLSSTSSSTTTTSTTINGKRADRGQPPEEEEEEEEVVELPRPSVSEGPPMATGCPSCLSYVLVSKDNPRCPRCGSRVPFPTRKKPRIELDLNSADTTTARLPTTTAAGAHL